MFVHLVVVTACQLPKDDSLTPIAELYGGEFSVESGMRAATTQGTVSFTKLICEENQLIDNGWLSPEAMAYNCAMLMMRAEPDVLERNDLLEVEMISMNQQVFSFEREELKYIETNYRTSEKTLATFVNHVKLNELEEAVALMDSSSFPESEFVEFLEQFRNACMADYKDMKLIGYTANRSTENLYDVDFFIISQDGTKKMAKVLLVGNEEHQRFKEVLY